MADNPADWEEKMRDIGLLLENVNAVLNLLRPHQAREGVKTMLLNRLEAAKEEMERCDEMKNEVERFLTTVEGEGKADNEPHCAGGITNGAHSAALPETQSSVETARRHWDLLDELDGD